ncbi:hypothetical protein PIB30_084327 [Stylosanthes scabra]|uniref:Uncharacterized protein n=1 Tax=Stylosanthes scabra TaxID=79078 RepID=A0ABU6SSU3_9FABA|nr:hypothetical protein [Stylosanthes scabra]
MWISSSTKENSATIEEKIKKKKNWFLLGKRSIFMISYIEFMIHIRTVWEISFSGVVKVDEMVFSQSISAFVEYLGNIHCILYFLLCFLFNLTDFLRPCPRAKLI